MAEFERHFYRCARCLGVFAIEGARVTQWDNQRGNVGPTCDCGGYTEHMGKVQRDRLVTSHLVCACDARCTSARGPSCDCQCGGKNHGTHRTVAVQTDHGSVPTISAPNDFAARVACAAEYDAAKSAAKARLEARHAATLEAMRAGKWVADKTAWWAAKTDQDALRKAGTYLIHGKRISALAKIAA